MTKDVRDSADIAVTPVFTDGSTTTICEIGDLPGGPGNNAKGGVIKLKKNKSYRLSFEIQSTAAVPNLKFKANGDDAFWCSTSVGCPTAKGVGGFLKNPVVSNNNRTLTVEADEGNSDLYDFYRLNFDDGTCWDPVIIKN